MQKVFWSAAPYSTVNEAKLQKVVENLPLKQDPDL
jgi:hypothetical protein